MEELSEESLRHLPKPLIERHVELQRQLDKKKEEKLESGNIQTQICYFLETFDDKTNTINETLNRMAEGSIQNNSFPDYFDKLTKDIQCLNRYLSTSSSFLRNYNIRKCKQTLDDLSVRCKDLEDKLIPKKKFGFKSKRNKAIDQKNSTITKIFGDETDGKISTKVSKWKHSIESEGFSNRTGECLRLAADEINGKDLQLSNLRDCTVILTGSPNTLHIASIDKCRIFCGPVSTSVFIDNCKNCTLAFPCQQLRIHHTSKTNFYIHVTCRAIIEDSEQIQVAPFNWFYKGIQDHFKLSGLDPDRNNWNLVDDFNWLAQDMPSPNWCAMAESERTANWNLDDLKK